jgi:hypothetical protein
MGFLSHKVMVKKLDDLEVTKSFLGPMNFARLISVMCPGKNLSILVYLMENHTKMDDDCWYPYFRLYIYF